MADETSKNGRPALFGTTGEDSRAAIQLDSQPHSLFLANTLRSFDLRGVIAMHMHCPILELRGIPATPSGITASLSRFYPRRFFLVQD